MTLTGRGKGWVKNRAKSEGRRAKGEGQRAQGKDPLPGGVRGGLKTGRRAKSEGRRAKGRKFKVQGSRFKYQKIISEI